MMRLGRRTAMTTLEVLCATVLATLLMTAVLGFTSGFAERQQRLAERDPQPPWAREIASVLGSDLESAESLRVHPDGLSLRGPLGRSVRSGIANWKPATVRYRMVDTGAPATGFALIRSLLPDSSDSQKVSSEIMGFNVAGIRLSPSISSEDAGVLVEDEVPAVESSLEKGSLPSRFVVVCRWNDPATSSVIVRVVRP